MHFHKWKVVDQKEQPSQWEIMTERMTGTFKAKSLPHDLAVRPVIVTYRCEKCPAEKVVRV